MELFWTYYVISVIYCEIKLFITYKKESTAGALNITPALDAIMVLILGWIIAPIDFFLTWIKYYKEAEEARRRNSDGNKIL